MEGERQLTTPKPFSFSLMFAILSAMLKNLLRPIRLVKGVGQRKAQDFARLGLTSLKDVLYDFPFRYDDLSNKQLIGDVQPGQKVTIRGSISAISNRRSKKNPRMVVTEAIVEDESGSIKAIWFHQGFLKKAIKTGTVVSLSGKADDQYGLALVNPVYEVVTKNTVAKHTGKIVPIYRLGGSLTQKVRRALAEEAIQFVDEIPEWLPETILKQQKFMPIQEAIRRMHFVDSLKKQEGALMRLKFEEFFLHQLLHRKARNELKQQKAPVVPFNEVIVKATVDSLPFDLTDVQRKAIWAIIKDMQRDQPMNRLLEGDVGTGKTIVAAVVARNVASEGWQSCMLAPTEILAEQHYNTLQGVFGADMRIALFTRTKRRVRGEEVTKAQMLEGLRNGKIDLVIGTHALLSDDVLFERLAFIVVDEQHRFGVRQRKALKDREGDSDGIPHLLSMTATPIPRSLALVLYGDLDRSLLDEYPVGRKPIVTKIVDPEDEMDVFEHMRAEMDAGRQVFVVCPLIEESDALGVQSVSETHTAFKSGPFENYEIGMLHGKMKTEEKDEVMARFASGELAMLVSTTVVEVGVDVPNATVMYIEGAERFGLAQLHQLRGRVGRGEHESYCYLHPSVNYSDIAKERLRALTLTQNGFILAEKDLKLRGPGDIFGTEQSGFETFKLGTFNDVDLISVAKDYAKDFLDEDPSLNTWPLLAERLDEYVDDIHFE